MTTSASVLHPEAFLSPLVIAEAVQRALGIPRPLRAKIVPYASLPGNYQDVLKRIPDTTKAKRVLGFTAQVGLDEGLAATMAWHVARREQAEALQA